MHKAHLLRCAAYNLGLLLRRMWGLVKPRNAGTGAGGLVLAAFALMVMGILCQRQWTTALLVTVTVSAGLIQTKFFGVRTQ